MAASVSSSRQIKSRRVSLPASFLFGSKFTAVVEGDGAGEDGRPGRAVVIGIIPVVDRNRKVRPRQQIAAHRVAPAHAGPAWAPGLVDATSPRVLVARGVDIGLVKEMVETGLGILKRPVGVYVGRQQRSV